MTAEAHDLCRAGFADSQAKVLTDAGGWTPIWDYASWAYASSTTITVPSGAATRYGKGMRLRWKQSGDSNYRYAYIIGAAATLLTVTGGSDYAVADTATSPIIEAAYSYFSAPLGFPEWFNWAVTFPAAGGMTFTGTNVRARFCINGRKVSFELFAQGTTSGSGVAYILATLPVTAAHAYCLRALCQVDDGGSLAGMAYLSDTSTLQVTKLSGGAFAVTTGRGIFPSAFYEMA